MGCQKYLAKLRKMKNAKSKIKPIKIAKNNLEQCIALGVKVIRRILDQKK